MITFISGSPGAGKTLYCIHKLLLKIIGSVVTAKDKRNQTVEIKRKVFTNVKGLLLDHELIDADYLAKWPEWAKPGDVICYDEVQEPWPPRPNGSKVPEHIQKLETHRHMGVDFILLSQHPLLIDRNVVNLVGRHLHIRRTAWIGAAIVYEWDHCSRALLYKNCMTKWPWKFDKKIFQLYKSAELHTKQDRKLPGLIWFILLGALVFPWLAYRTYENIMLKPSKPATAAASGGTAVVPGTTGAQPSQSQAQPLTPVQYTASFVPRVDGIPHTAPRYDQLTQPTEPPVIAACLDGKNLRTGKNECNCYTQQATPITLSFDLCRQIAQQGFFQDFRAPSQAQAQQASQQAAKPVQTSTVASDPLPTALPPQTVAQAVLHEARPPDRGQHDGEILRTMTRTPVVNAVR